MFARTMQGVQSYPRTMIVASAGPGSSVITYLLNQDDISTFAPTLLTISSSAGNAPGGATAYSAIPTAVNGGHYAYSTSFSVVSGTSYTVICHFKASGVTTGALSMYNTTLGSFGRVVFDLTAGTITATESAGDGFYVPSNGAITSDGGGWYQVSLTVSPNATQAALLLFHVQTSAAFTGDAVNGLLLWRAQVY